MAERSFGKYVVARRLGHGGMAEVYEARDPLLDRRVAIKVILPHLAAQEDFIRRFLREAKLVASLRHPHIVRLFDYEVADGQPFMVMEYLDGGTLAERLAGYRSQRQLFPLGQIVPLLQPIAAALDYAHQQGAVHRDIKPANILFTASGEPVVTDFGIARLLTAATQLSAAGSIVGTAAYMAPEQVSGGTIDARSDLYALGIMLYELATGRVPFQGDSVSAILMKHLNEEPPPPRQFNSNLPAAVEAVLNKALAKRPAERFESASGMVAAFAAALRGEAPAGAAPDPASLTAMVTAIAETPQLSPAPGPAIAEPSTVAREPAGPTAIAGDSPSLSAQPASLADDGLPVADDQSPITEDAPPSYPLTKAGVLLLLGTITGLGQWLLGDPLGIYLLLLAILFLTASAVVAATVWRRSTSTEQRRGAISVIGASLLLSAIWIGLIAGLPQTAGARNLLIVVGDFDGSHATRQVDFGRRIFEQLEREIGLLDGVAVTRSGEIYADGPAARVAGEAQGATLVIWGWYDDLGVSSHVEVLELPEAATRPAPASLLVDTAFAAGPPAPGPPPPTLQLLSAPLLRAPLSLPAFDLFVARGPQEMTYMAASVLGLAFYLEGELDQALRFLNEALENAPAADEIAGQDETAGVEVLYFYQANILYERGQLDQAIAALETAVSLRPDLFEAHYNLAIAYAAPCSPARRLETPAAVYAQAVTAAERAVELEPASAAAHRLLGHLYSEAGQYEAAAAALERAVSLDPADDEALSLLAIVHQQTGQDERAAELRQQVIALRQQQLAAQQADRLQTYLSLGDAYVAAGEYEAAIEQYEAARSLSASAPAVYQGLGNAYYWQGKYESAENAYQTWAELAPEAATPALMLGLVAQAQGQPDQAVAHLERAAELAPCDPAAGILLGGLYWEQEDHERAAGAYEAAAATEPSNAAIHTLLGLLRLREGELGAAAASLERAIALQPALAEAHFYLGQTYAAQGQTARASEQWEMAVAQWQEAVEAQPDDVAAYAALAYTYEQLGQLEAAAAAYRQALAIEADAGNHISLGGIYYRQGDYESAIAEYESGLALEPEAALAALAYSGLGHAYAAQEAWPEAQEAYQQALERQEDAETHAFLGQAYFQQGDVASALTHYQQGLTLDPESYVVHYGLGELHRQQGNAAAALSAYRQALALNEQAPLRPLIASMLLSLGRAEEAIAEYELLLAANPQDHLSRLALADLHRQLGALEAADSHYQPLLLIPQHAAQAHFGLGYLAYKACRPSDMEQALLAATAAAPGVSLYQASLAAAYEAQGKADEADALYAQLAAAEGDPLAHLLAGNYFLRTGQFDEAATQLQLARQAAGAPLLTSLAYDYLGQVAYHQGEMEAARGAFEAALAALPANANALVWLGMIHMRQDDPAAAIATFEQATGRLGDYRGQVGIENAALLEVQIPLLRSLALSSQGEEEAAEEALAAALAAAEALSDQSPQWPLAHLVLGQVYRLLDQDTQAGVAYARAEQCDRSLSAVRLRIEDELKALGATIG